MRRIHSILISAGTVVILFSCASVDRVPYRQSGEGGVLERANPWDVGLDFRELNKGYAGIRTALSEKAAPGAVALLAKDGKVVRRRAFGYAQLYADPEEQTESEEDEPEFASRRVYMRTTTVFDLASLTKMVATTTSVMILVEQGKVDLDTPVCRYIPEFGKAAKENVTVRHLLTHTSGLPAWITLYQLGEGEKELFEVICNHELDTPPGYQRVYSDLGFITLGVLVERVSGLSLDRFAEKYIFEPLNMEDTGFRPRGKLRKRAAATEFSPWHKRFLIGEVHDENAYAMGGVAGHAGLFSTADDLAIFCQMLLNEGSYGDVRIMKPETVRLMLTPQVGQEVLERGSGFLKGREQLLGWWQMGSKPEVTGSGGLPSGKAYGHTGFTGTSIWIDPEHHIFAILLMNAVHPSRETCNRAAVRKALQFRLARPGNRTTRGGEGELTLAGHVYFGVQDVW